MPEELSLSEKIAEYVVKKGTDPARMGSYFEYSGELEDKREYSLYFRPGVGVGNPAEEGVARLLEISIKPSISERGFIAGETAPVSKESILEGLCGRLYQFSIMYYPDKRVQIYSFNDEKKECEDPTVIEQYKEILELVLRNITKGE